MNDINGQSYISTVILPGSDVTHYIKDAEARDAVTALEQDKQDEINVSGLLKGSGNGAVAAAVAGTDYLAPVVATASPNTDGTATEYIDTVSQSTTGRITATKKQIPTASASVAGLTKLGAAGGADTFGSAASAEQAAKNYADQLIAGLGSYMTLRGAKGSEAQIKATTSAAKGDVYINTADNSEWVCLENISAANANVWEKLGYNIDLSALAEISDLGDMAYADSSVASYQPEGTITINSYTPEGSITANSSGTANYTPAGTVSTPSITVVPTTTTVGSVTDVGTLPAWSASVANETLSFSFSAGTLPTANNTTVATGIQSASATQPTFTGTGTELSFEGSAKQPTGSFTGTSATITSTPVAGS